MKSEASLIDAIPFFYLFINVKPSVDILASLHLPGYLRTKTGCGKAEGLLSKIRNSNKLGRIILFEKRNGEMKRLSPMDRLKLVGMKRRSERGAQSLFIRIG